MSKEKKPPDRSVRSLVTIGNDGRSRRQDLRGLSEKLTKARERKKKKKEEGQPIEDTRVSDAWGRIERQAQARSDEHIRIEKVKGPRRDIARDVRKREASEKESATPERWLRAEGNVEISDSGVQRISDQPLDRLLGRHTITNRQYQAGDQLRIDFINSGMRPISASDIRSGGGSSPDSRWTPGFMAATEKQAAARIRFRKAHEAIGPRLFAVLDVIIIDPMEPEMEPNAYDLALVGMRFFGRKNKETSRTAIIEMAKLSLDELADHYGLEPDGHEGRRHVYNPDGKAKMDESKWRK